MHTSTSTHNHMNWFQKLDQILLKKLDYQKCCTLMNQLMNQILQFVLSYLTKFLNQKLEEEMYLFLNIKANFQENQKERRLAKVSVMVQNWEATLALRMVISIQIMTNSTFDQISLEYLFRSFKASN